MLHLQLFEIMQTAVQICRHDILWTNVYEGKKNKRPLVLNASLSCAPGAVSCSLALCLFYHFFPLRSFGSIKKHHTITKHSISWPLRLPVVTRRLRDMMLTLWSLQMAATRGSVSLRGNAETETCDGRIQIPRVHASNTCKHKFQASAYDQAVKLSNTNKEQKYP